MRWPDEAESLEAKDVRKGKGLVATTRPQPITGRQHRKKFRPPTAQHPLDALTHPRSKHVACRFKSMPVDNLRMSSTALNTPYSRTP